jgi:AcrR family transcriptional regulator
MTANGDVEHAEMDGSAARPKQRRALLRYKRARETRERLAVGAAKLFGERGYDAVTVDDICARAGVSRSSYYFHFANKEAILAELDAVAARHVATEMARASAGETSIDDAAEIFIEGLARRALRVPRDLLAQTMASAMRGLPAVGRLPDEEADFGRALAEAFRRAQARGEVGAGESADELGAIAAAMAMEGLLRWAHGTTADAELRAVLRRRMSIVLDGVRRRG